MQIIENTCKSKENDANVGELKNNYKKTKEQKQWT